MNQPVDPSLSLIHLVRHPTPSNSSPPPLLLLSHGLGSHEADLLGLAPYLDPRFLIISVRAPHPYGPGYTWFNLEIRPDQIIADMEQAAASMEQLQTFLQEAISTYGADPQQVYLMGFSQGGIMSLCLTLSDPQQIAGVVVMSGRMPDEAVFPLPTDPAPFQDLPILVVHGLYDPVLPIQEGRRIRDRLQTLPVQLTYQEYPMAHQVSQESLRDITLWLSNRLGSA